MQRVRCQLLRGFCTLSSSSSEKIVASVLFERLRVVIPKPDPTLYAFQEFKFNWEQQFRRRYPDEFLDIAKNRAKGEYQMDPELPRLTRITIGSKSCSNQHGLVLFSFAYSFKLSAAAILYRSLYRALDNKLYLLIFGKPFGATSDKPVWHFPEKLYDSDEPTLRKRFFFKCSVVAASKYNISNCEDFVWVTKDELLEFFPEQADFFNKMIIS